MEGKTHAGIGAVTYIAVCHHLYDKFNLLGILVVIFASLFPDIDHPKSIVNKYILPIKNSSSKKVFYLCLGIIVLVFDYLYVSEAGVKALGVALIAIAFSSHRNGLTHSLTGMIVFTYIVAYVSGKYNLSHLTKCFIIGYCVHLLGDMFTKRGIPLFYPFIKKKYKFILTYKVGSKFGRVIEGFIMVFGLVYVIYLVYTFPNIFKN